MTGALPDAGPARPTSMPSEIVVPDDPFDVRLALGATGCCAPSTRPAC